MDCLKFLVEFARSQSFDGIFFQSCGSRRPVHLMVASLLQSNLAGNYRQQLSIAGWLHYLHYLDDFYEKELRKPSKFHLGLRGLGDPKHRVQ